MRAALYLVLALLAGCATEPQLDVAPAPGVDLSGHWRLNAADSDDPLRLTQALSAGLGPVSQGQGGGGGQSRGRRGGQGSQGGPGAPLPNGQPVTIPTSIVADLLRWPGLTLDVSQQGGVATFASDGDSRIYQPRAGASAGSGRAPKKGRRSSAPPLCGWSGSSLLVRVEPEDELPGYDASYRVSDDGARLVQVITLRGGRLTGFTMSRVWDRQ